MSSLKSTGFSNNLQSLLTACQSFVKRHLMLSQPTPETVILFDVSDAAFQNGASSHADMERRLRWLDRSHLAALVHLKTLA